MLKLKYFTTVLILSAVLLSCKIGNFMDIGNNFYNTPLFLYVQTVNELRIYEIDTENGTLNDKGSFPLISELNNCNLLYENEKKLLFVSHGNNPAYSISAFNINGDGSLDLISGYPRTDFTVDPVEDFLFENNKSFFYAIAGGNIYGFVYESNGFINPTAPATWGGVNTPLEGRGIEIYDGYLMKQDNADSNMMYSIDSGTGNLGAPVNPAPEIDRSSLGALIVSNGYVYKLSGGMPNWVYAYSIDVPGVTTNQISGEAFGSVAVSSNNAFVRDPEGRFLYFVSDTENIIFCFRTNTDGSIGSAIDEITTGMAPSAAAIDPYRQFFFTAGNDGGWQINIHRMGGDLPENSYDHISIPDQIFELYAVRYSD